MQITLEFLPFPFFCSRIITTYNPLLLHKSCFSTDFTGAELNPALPIIPTAIAGIQLHRSYSWTIELYHLLMLSQEEKIFSRAAILPSRVLSS